MDEKRFRFDLLIAILAVTISGIAAAASAYQTYVIRQQFSATVWPYLTFVSRSSTDRFIELDVSNVGIGPAIVRSATILRDGKPIVVPIDPSKKPAIFYAIGPERAAAARDEAGRHVHNDLTITSIAPGDVISAGEKLQILRAEGTYLARHVMADIGRVDINVCYCSLLGQCWTKRLWDPSAEPHAVHDCPQAS